MALVLNGDGNVTGLTAGGLPDASITQTELAANIAGNGPVIVVYQSGGQSIPNVTWTKISLDTELFDTGSAFASNNFTPQVAGYYYVSAQVYYGASSGWCTSNIRKNGIGYAYGTSVSATPNGMITNANKIFYLNGSTDYVDFATYQSTGGSTSTIASIEGTSFCAVLLRAA